MNSASHGGAYRFAAIVRLSLLAAFCLYFNKGAFAGRWTTQYVAAGTITATWPNGGWSKSWATDGTAANGSFGPSFSATSAGKITATLTWIPDNVNDPAPPELILIETASNGWSAVATCFYPQYCQWGFGGAASNDIGTYQITSTSGAQQSGRCSGTRKVTVGSSSGTVVRTCNFTASMSGWFNGPGSGNGTAGPASFTVSIHAHPYDFKVDRVEIAKENALRRQGLRYTHPNYMSQCLGVADGGQVYIPYIWKSTSGSLADLNGIIVYEQILWSGDGDNIIGFDGQNYFTPFHPPFGDVLLPNVTTDWSRPNPYDGKGLGEQLSGSRGWILDRHTRRSLWVPPGKGATIRGRTYFSYEGRQSWDFDCSVCGIVGRRMPSTTGEAGLNAILREYFRLDGDACPCPEDPYSDVWRFRTSKHGFIAWEDWHNVFGVGSLPFQSNSANP